MDSKLIAFEISEEFSFEINPSTLSLKNYLNFCSFKN